MATLIQNPFTPLDTEIIFVIAYQRTWDGTGRPTHFSATNLAGTQYFDARIVWKGMNQKADEWDEIMDAEGTNFIEYQFGNGVLMRDKATRVREAFGEWLEGFDRWQMWTDDLMERSVWLSHLGMTGYNVMDLSTAAFLLGVNFGNERRKALHYVRNQQNAGSPGHYARVGITIINRIKNGIEGRNFG